MEKELGCSGPEWTTQTSHKKETLFPRSTKYLLWFSKSFNCVQKSIKSLTLHDKTKSDIMVNGSPSFWLPPVRAQSVLQLRQLEQAASFFPPQTQLSTRQSSNQNCLSISVRSKKWSWPNGSAVSLTALHSLRLLVGSAEEDARTAVQRSLTLIYSNKTLVLIHPIRKTVVRSALCLPQKWLPCFSLMACVKFMCKPLQFPEWIWSNWYPQSIPVCTVSSH